MTDRIQTFEAVLPLTDGESVQQFNDRLWAALDPVLEGDVDRGWWWIRALFGDSVVVHLHRTTLREDSVRESEDWHEMISFTREGTTFSLGERQRVVVDFTTTFTPVSAQVSEMFETPRADRHAAIREAVVANRQ